MSTSPAATTRRSKPEPAAAKVPEIIALFWVIKVITTGMGEAASDFLGNEHIVLAAIACVVVFPFSIWLQRRATKYIAPIYWFAISMVAVFGTVVADGLHVGLHVPYFVSSAVLVATLIFVFRRWHRTEGTLSIHSIITRRRETYYWWTVLLTFALGTSLGDMTAAEFHWGFFTSIFIFAALILVPLVGRLAFRMNEVFAFWFAYILTRPLGASIADWMGKKSGLGYGDDKVVYVALAAIVLLVGYVAVRKNDIQQMEVVRDDLPPVRNPAATA
jgi:uncharacterized membrane-anchored protein